MGAYAKNIAPYVSYYVTSNSITVYVDPSVSSIFDTAGANYCNLTCNGAQATGMRSTGYPEIVFTGLSPSTQYAVTIDVMYAAGYSGNYGYQTLYITTDGPTYYTMTMRHYKTNTYYTTTTHQILEGTRLDNTSHYAISIDGYSYWQTTATESRSGTQVITPYINSNVTYYMWYDQVTQYCTLTFNHYLQLSDGSMSSSPSATTSASVAVRSYVWLADYNYGYAADSYYYSSGSLAGTSTIVGGFYASGDATYDLDYARTTYTITAGAGTGIGSVSGSNTTWWGNTIAVSASVSTGYAFSEWISNNPSYLSGSTSQYYVFTMPKANVTLTATATARVACTLNLYCSGYTTTVTGAGTTSPSGGSIYVSAYVGDSVTISCTKPNNTTYYTYTLQGWYTGPSGAGDRWSSSLSFTYTLQGNTTLYAYTTRTAGFAWDVAKVPGSNTITAAEWLKLQNFINAQRPTPYSFQYTPAVGDSLSADIYNEMVTSMNASSYSVSKGQEVTAACLNLLVTLANSM